MVREAGRRESLFEILRIIAMAFIIAMHSIGPAVNEFHGIQLIFGIILSDLGNVGVSYFALCSGFFGVGLSIDKVLIYIKSN